MGKKLLLIGFGHVGRRLLERLIASRPVTLIPHHHPFKIVGIYTRSHGSLLNSGGINGKRALDLFAKDGRFDYPDKTPASVLSAVRETDYDILIELTTLTIAERGEPAFSFIQEALRRGKDVVTANKGPLAYHYKTLSRTLKQNNGRLLYEATVMDGAPVFSLIKRCLPSASIRSLSGILNSTSNHVLCGLETDKTLAEAADEARRLGFAERNINHDLDGWDSAVKLSILCQSLMGGAITPEQIPREGIRHVTRERLLSARAESSRLKLICRAWWKNNTIHTRVQVEKIPRNHVFSQIYGAGCALTVETDHMTPLTIIQENPGLDDTVSGILDDLYQLVH